MATGFADQTTTVPGVSATGLVNLPVANVRPAYDPFNDRDFTTIPNVPIFAEHKTIARDGRQLLFGREELQAIVDRCNRRIAETGDYAAVVIGHTPDPEAEAAGATQPDVVGFAGPFRIGVLGQPGARQRFAILCDFHIFADEMERVKRHPRRSPELWLEDSYDEMFLDPIALLGSEAPRLDMGLLLYAGLRHGRLCEKYAAVAPAAGNAFVPSHDTGRQKYSPVQDSPNQGVLSMLTPDDVRQIVDALEQLDWVQYVKSQMQAAQGDNGTGTGGDAPPPSSADNTPPVPAPEPQAATPPVHPADVPPADMPPEVRKEDDMPEKSAKQLYAAEGSVDGDETIAAGSVEDETKTPDKYQRLTAEMAQLRAALNEERSRRVDTERYARLQQLRHRFTFDLDGEFKRCRYSKMDATAFGEHVESIEKNYRPIPVDQLLPVDGRIPVSDGPGSAARRERYSRELSDKARRICEQRAVRGESVDYEEILESLHEGREVAV